MSPATLTQAQTESLDSLGFVVLVDPPVETRALFGETVDGHRFWMGPSGKVRWYDREARS